MVVVGGGDPKLGHQNDQHLTMTIDASWRHIKGVNVLHLHEAMVLVCLPLAAPIGLSPVVSLTLGGCERGLIVSTELLDDLSCLATPGLAILETGCAVHPDAHS